MNEPYEGLAAMSISNHFKDIIAISCHSMISMLISVLFHRTQIGVLVNYGQVLSPRR